MLGPDSINEESGDKSSADTRTPSITIYQKLKELQELRSKKLKEDSTINAAPPASVDLHLESQQLLESLLQEFEDKNIKLQLQQFYDDAPVTKEEDAALKALPDFKTDTYYPTVFAKLLPYVRLMCAIEVGNSLEYAYKLAIAFNSESKALAFLDEEFEKNPSSVHPLAEACSFTLKNVGRQYWSYAPDVAGQMIMFVGNRAFELLKKDTPFYKSVSNKAQFWQPLIQTYFPHLQAARLEAYNNTPRKLFEDAYEFCIRELGSTNKQDVPFLLSSLRGDLTAVKSAYSGTRVISAIDFIAMANGYTEELDKLSSHLKDYVFKIAAGLGHLSVVLTLLPLVDNFHKGVALEYAAKNGHLVVVQELLTRVGSKISAGHKGVALRCAAQNGHLAVVQKLLTVSDADCQGLALRDAAQNGHLAVVQELLTRVGSEISAYNKGLALRDAAQNSHLAVVQELLTRVGSEISADYKGLALCYAAQNDHLAVVQELLTRVGGEISTDDKGSALRIAAQNGHLGIVKAISDYISPEKQKALALLDATQTTDGDIEPTAIAPTLVFQSAAASSSQSTRHSTTLLPVDAQKREHDSINDNDLEDTSRKKTQSQSSASDDSTIEETQEDLNRPGEKRARSDNTSRKKR